MSPGTESRDAILGQARRVAASALFENAGRSKALLEYLARELAEGRAGQLKEYTIGAEALGRGDSFDPRTDTIVRAEASRLRGRLERYYATEGRDDPWILALPKGGYVLDVRKRDLPPDGSGAGSTANRRARPLILLAASAAIFLAAALWILSRPGELPSSPPMTLEVELKARGFVGSIVGTDVIISPDGSRLAFVSQDPNGTSRLNIHRLDRSQSVELPGTEGARGPFFSPDGQWVGFWALGKLQKTHVERGSPMVLCEAGSMLGAGWAEDGSIIASFDGRLWRVPADGGAPAMLTAPAGPAQHAWPQILPGSRNVLYTSVPGGGADQSAIEILSLATGKSQTVARGGTFARVLPGGYLTYVRQRTLFAVPFDLDRLQTRGSEAPLLDGVSYDSVFGYAQLDVSRTGTLVYRKNSGATVQWLDENGRTSPILAGTGHFVWPSLSPGGRRIALVTTEGGRNTISVHDLESGNGRQLATGHYSALWSPDGRILILGGANGLHWIHADGPGLPKPFGTGRELQIPTAFSADGKLLAFASLKPGSHFDLYTVTVDADGGVLRPREPRLFLAGPGVETYPALSPEGRWIAYVSDNEVYVQPFPAGGARVKISPAGGRVPKWSPRGEQLFFRTHDHRLMVAAYSAAGKEFTVESVRPWSSARLFDTGVMANFDIGPDGRIAALLPAASPEDRQSENHVTIILHFLDNVRRQLTARN